MVAGTAGGLHLVAPVGALTRPTADRVKESLFAALGDRVADAKVLDLYAGSGALAIEALSRGAARAVLVERDPAALETIERNLESTRLDEHARVHRGNVLPFLGGLLAPEAPFDLVLADPPYEVGDAEVGAVLERLEERGWLASPATVVVERAVGSSSAVPARWVVASERAYGDTLVLIASA